MPHIKTTRISLDQVQNQLLSYWQTLSKSGAELREASLRQKPALWIKSMLDTDSSQSGAFHKTPKDVS